MLLHKERRQRGAFFAFTTERRDSCPPRMPCAKQQKNAVPGKPQHSVNVQKASPSLPTWQKTGIILLQSQRKLLLEGVIFQQGGGVLVPPCRPFALFVLLLHIIARNRALRKVSCFFCFFRNLFYSEKNVFGGMGLRCKTSRQSSTFLMSRFNVPSGL